MDLSSFYVTPIIKKYLLTYLATKREALSQVLQAPP
jgi:hypothetical protein